MKKFIWLFILNIVAILCLSGKGIAGDNPVEGIGVQAGSSVSLIKIKFNGLYQYIKHNPQKMGDYFEVELKEVIPGSAGIRSLTERQVISWEPTETVPLDEVIYEMRADGRVILSFKFTRPVRFSIESGNDFRSLVIRIPTGGGLKSGVREIDSLETIEKESEAKLSKAGLRMKIKDGVKKEKREIDEEKSYFVINLLATRRPLKPEDVPVYPEMKGYTVYVVPVKSRGKVWYQARLGFFETSEAAKAVLNAIKDKFPGPWVVKAKVEDLKFLEKWEVSKKGFPRNERAVEEVPEREAMEKEEVGKKRVEEKIKRLVEEGKTAMTEGNYRRAVQVFTKVLEYPENEYRKEAMELLGLAREKNRQLAQARAVYEKYLEEYPEGEDAERVKQRLLAILTAASKPRRKLKEPKAGVEQDRWRKEIFGSFSQFYNRDESFSDIEGDTLNLSVLSSDLDLTARGIKKSNEIGFQFLGGYDWDFVESDESEFWVSELNTYYKKRKKYSVQLGRHSYSKGGVFGRIDGGNCSVKLSRYVDVNIVGGFPVDSSSNGLDSDRWFYGVNLDLGPMGKRLDVNLYFIDQRVDSIVDRRALGFESRFFFPGMSFFSLVDYDVSYETTNIILFVGNKVFRDGSTIHFSVDYRRSPILTTSNALQGQNVETISELLVTRSEEEVKQLALDRTPIFRSGSMGGSLTVNEKIQLSLDLTVSELTGTPASGGVEAQPGTGAEYFALFQVVGSNLIKTGDIAILGLSYSHQSSSDRGSVSINTRYPLNDSWRLNPKIRGDYSWDDSDGSEEYTLTGSVRVDVRIKRRATIELEVGGEWRANRISGLNERSTGYFVTAGYRINF